MSKAKISVRLNGTSTNPYEKFGLTQNPFPQLGRSEFASAEARLQRLGGPPIPADRAEEYIRETLKGFSEQFITLCVKNYRPGEMVQFNIQWDE